MPVTESILSCTGWYLPTVGESSRVSLLLDLAGCTPSQPGSAYAHGLSVDPNATNLAANLC